MDTPRITINKIEEKKHILRESTESLFSSIALISIAFAVFIVLSSYFYGFLQPVRWPTLTYFALFLLVTLYSRQWALTLLIIALPLLPDLHIQLEYIRHPAVKYFVAYPGVDAISGITVGLFLRAVFYRKLGGFSVKIVPWPFGVFLCSILVSLVVAISRNLWQSGSSFDIGDFFYNALRFKLVQSSSIYGPFVDFVVYSYAVLATVIFYGYFKAVRNSDDLLFKPLALGLVLSALWGIFQALTSFGLPITTSGYRTEEFGYGAHGFQPDLHAFAAHMLIGAVGLFGYFFRLRSRNERVGLIFVTLLSWLALIMSKSRASLVLAIVFTALTGLVYLFKKGVRDPKKIISIFLICAALALVLMMSSYGSWISTTYHLIATSGSLDFDTINQLTRWRAELHLAAVRMWSQFPIFGLGLGEFFKLSANFEFSHSLLMAKSGGENAHNYFLQILAELGIAGFICSVLIFACPLWRNDNRQACLPVCFGIAAIFLGNVYSHSLIIRENLFLLSILTASLYASSGDAKLRVIKGRPSVVIGFYILVTVFFIVGVKEIYDSFGKFPFK